MVRLALNLQETVCSRGVRELGGVLEDPVAAALCLAQVLDARKLQRRHPIAWTVPFSRRRGRAASGGQVEDRRQAKAASKPRAKRDARAAAKPAAPAMATPENFFKYSFPYGSNLLKYKIQRGRHTTRMAVSG